MRPAHSLKSSQVRPPRETGRDAAHRHRNARRPCRTSLGACSEVQAAREGAVAARAGGGGEGAAPRPVLANCACWSVCWHALPAAAGTRLRAGPCARCTPLALPGCSPITHCAWRRAGKRRGRGAKRLARLPPRRAPPPNWRRPGLSPSRPRTGGRHALRPSLGAYRPATDWEAGAHGVCLWGESRAGAAHARVGGADGKLMGGGGRADTPGRASALPAPALRPTVGGPAPPPPPIACMHWPSPDLGRWIGQSVPGQRGVPDFRTPS